jgi:hypothetical protein
MDECAFWSYGNKPSFDIGWEGDCRTQSRRSLPSMAMPTRGPIGDIQQPAKLITGSKLSSEQLIGIPQRIAGSRHSLSVSFTPS